ncbi:hypothetical protein LOTGIDRAFT_228602 [Lottia gigantea]|uniref:Poly [ADP-ribose] polymerase n=1 Tax=Lottia gigantea TaxID=225164 RepID=V4AFG2_LOTGI|nr:hypothetical protein LOTGIDRAFT_228602 [Lottia gigantea]ESO93840.1 hypothetical protein LOTGIDRAFT_228602 [Lottia gigantea]
MAKDGSMLVVLQNIPKNWNNYTVIDFLEVYCDDVDVEILTVEYFQNEKTVAKTGFSHSVDFQRLVEKSKREKYGIEIMMLPPADGLIFTNLSPDVTIDKILKHFNSVKGGKAIQKRNFYESNGCFVLKIYNTKVIDTLVKKVIPGASVEVFYDVFQGEALRRLEQINREQISDDEDNVDSNENCYLTCEDSDSDKDSDCDSDSGSENILAIDMDDIHINEESSSSSSRNSQNASDRNTEEKEIPIETSEYVFDQNDYHKAKLLEKINFGNNLKNCEVQISVTSSISKIVFKGKKEDIDISKIEMFELLRSIDKRITQKLQKPFLEILNSVKGEQYLSSIFDGTDEVIGYMEKDALAVAGINPTEITQFLRFSENQFLIEKIPIKDSYRHFVASSWNELKEKEEMFLIKLVQEQDMIVIYGLNGDVVAVKKDILAVLLQNQHDTKTITLTGAMSRCIALYFKASINSLRDSLRDCHGTLQDELSESSYNIEVSGSPEKVQQVLKKIGDIKESVWHEQVLLKRDITQNGAELKLLVCSLKTTNQKRFITTFETENKCCIEFLNLKPEHRNDFPRASFPSRNSKPRIPRKPSFLKRPSSNYRPTCSVNFHQATITVKKGDITREKAFEAEKTKAGFNPSSPVNVDLSMAFSAKNSINVPVGTILETACFGNLNCKYVLHVLLEKYKGATSLQVLSKAIRNVLLKSNAHNVSSVAFPALGVGKLYRFPPDKISAVCLQELQDSIKSYPNIKNVTFVIYDDEVYKEFSNQMSNYGYSPPQSPDRGAAALVSSESESNSDSEDDFTIHSAQDKAVYDSPESGIKLYCDSKMTSDKAKNNLIKYLTTTYLYRDSVKDDTIIHLNKYILREIKAHAERFHVSIILPDIKQKDIQQKHVPEIKFQGKIQAVKDAKVKIQEILLKEIHKQHAFNDKSSEDPIPKRGTLEHLHYMVSNTEQKPPAYWKKSKPFTSKVKEYLGNKKNILEPLSSTSSLYKCIEDLVQKTWRADKCGHGRDAANLNHKNIQVTTIERVENTVLYYKYCARRRELFSKALERKTPCTNISRIPNSSGPMLTTKLAGKELTEDIFPEVNEHYAFHGTSRAKAISQEGLDHRSSGDNNLFGSAVYMSESSTKADQYADSKQNRTPGPKQMILGRILLGNTYLCIGKNPTKYKRPPCTDLTHLKSHCEQGHEFFDSVMADGTWLFREFAVYDNSSVYPEYIITYNRI